MNVQNALVDITLYNQRMPVFLIVLKDLLNLRVDVYHVKILVRTALLMDAINVLKDTINMKEYALKIVQMELMVIGGPNLVNNAIMLVKIVLLEVIIVV
jgi:hypothetical protein